MKRSFVKYSQSDFQDFSFPINKEFRNSIAVAGIQAGIVVAYASDRLIIVLMSGKYIAAILKGHTARVCTLAFEQREPHIISCDVEANCYFWHYHENSWENTRTVQISSPVTSIVWCGFRRIICYSSKDGLFSSPVSTFGTDKKKLAPKSEICAFNFDASLIASHTFGKYLTIFNLTLENYCEVLKLSSNIIKFDFHPRLPILLTYSQDGIIRIWKQSKYSTFACSAAINAPSPGCFIHMPIFFPEKYTFRKNHMGKIAFIDDNEKIITLNLSENGRFISGKPAAAFEGFNFTNKKHNVPIQAYHTNTGTLALTVNENNISLVMKSTKNTLFSKTTFLYHTEKVISASFSTDSQSLATLDKSGIMIIWFLYNIFKNPFIASKDVQAIRYLTQNQVLFSKLNKLYKIDINTKEIKQIEFPEYSDIKSLFIFNGQPYVLTQNQILSKNTKKDIKPYDFFSISKEYDNNCLLVLGKKNGEIRTIYLSDMKELEVPSIDKEIYDVCAVSIYEFSVMSKNEAIFFSNPEGTRFIENGEMVTPPLKGFSVDSHIMASRIIAHDGSSIISLQNNPTKLVTLRELQSAIDFIVVSPIGDLCVVCDKNFYFHSGFSQLYWDERIPFRRHQQQNKEQTVTIEEHKIIKQLDRDCDVMVSPDIYLERRTDAANICRNTLVHLLEFSSAYSLDDVNPIQMPAFPNQIAFPDSFFLPETADSSYLKSLETIKSITGDLDMFSLRYILGILESNKPPTFLGLWLSFSATQAQSLQYISDKITTANISPFFIGICIKDQRLLEDFTSKALSNTWILFKKPELVALFHIAMGNVQKLPKLYNIVEDNPRAEFFKKDFTQERWRKSALKNAYSSLSHHGFDMAAALFLVAGDVESAVGVIVNQMKDPILAFHIIRLVEKTANGPYMKKFLQTVEWDDEVIPCIISNLISPSETKEKLKKALVSPLKPTIFGDQRPALFQILYHLSRNKNDATAVAHSLLCSGLAPLASYVLKYSECPYDKPRLTGANVIDIIEQDQKQNKEEEEEEEQPKKNMFASSTNSEDEDTNFDFGGGGMDDWDDRTEDSDDWKSSESEDEDDVKKNKEKSEDEEYSEKETEKIEQKDEDKLSILVKEYISRRVKSLCNLFSEKSIIDNDAASFCIHFAAIDLGRTFLDDKEKQILAGKLSTYIDFCCMLFLNSAKIPSKPANLFGLLLYLHSFYCDPNEALTLKSIKEMPSNGFMHSVFFGAFTVGLWTFLHHLICQILGSPRVNTILFVPSDLPPAQALFNADIFAPRYPDSVPDLLSRYATGTSLDRDRTLAMILLLKRFYNETAHFTHEKDKEWQEHILARLWSLMKTLHFFQVAFQSPPFALPNTIGTLHPLTEIVVDTHKAEQLYLAIIQKKSLEKVAMPAIFRGNQFAFSKEDVSIITFNGNCLSFAVTPLCKQKFVVVSDQVYMTHLDRKHSHPLFGFTQNMLSDIVTLLSHPHFDLFILVTRTNAYLMDGSQKDEVIFHLDTNSITCAAFSPNGTKVAFGTANELIIIQLEIGRENIYPVFRMPCSKQISSLCWLNSDTQLIIGSDSCLMLADTLTCELFRLSDNASWGPVTCVKLDDNCKFLVFGTMSGKTVIVDMNKGFEVVCVYSMTSAIVSIVILLDLCVIASSDGLITAFPIGKTALHASFNSPVPITCFTALDDSVIATGSKFLLVWKVQ